MVDHCHLKTNCMVKTNMLNITVTTITNTIIDLEIIAITIAVVVIIIIITRRTMNDSASVERKGQKRRQTGNICVGNVARTNPFHSRLHFHFLQLRNLEMSLSLSRKFHFHSLNVNLRLRSLAAVVVVDEVGSLPRQLALMETGANQR